MPFLRMYFASKTIHAERWRQIDLTSPHIKVTSRWIKQVILDEGDIIHKSRDIGRQGADIRDFAARCWMEDQQDVENSDFVVLYAEEGEHLRGGLVEAGMAISTGIPVICIGTHPDYGSWQWHPMVMRQPSLESLEAWAAREIAYRIEQMKSQYLQGV